MMLGLHVRSPQVLVCVAAGTGVVPFLDLVRWLVYEQPCGTKRTKLTCTLLVCDKTPSAAVKFDWLLKAEAEAAVTKAFTLHACFSQVANEGTCWLACACL